MKKILSLISGLLLAAMTLSAQQTLYVIDNETVDQFDGSQLKGKIIRDYKITTQGSGRSAITVHAITTSPSVYSLTGSFSRLDSLKLHDFSKFKFDADTVFLGRDIIIHNPLHEKIVYIIDGEKSEGTSAFEKISPLDIERIKVIGSEDVKKMGYSEGVVVIQIETKKEGK